MPANKDLPLTRIVDALMANKETAETDQYLYFDPKAMKSKGAARKVTTPFKDCFVFVLGGGNFSEYQNLLDHAKKSSTPNSTKTIVYGSTEVQSPTQFLCQLQVLGCGQESPNKPTDTDNFGHR